MSCELPREVWGLKGRVDRTGLVSITVPFVVRDLTEAVTFPPTDYLGLRKTETDIAARPSGNGYDVSVTYEGLQSDGGAPQDADEDSGDGEWEIDNEWAEEPLESHPLILDILAEYGGFLDAEGKARFPETIPEGRARGGSGLFGDRRRRAGDKNPAFGLETYFQTGSVVRLTTVRSEVPRTFFRAVGQVIDKLPIRALADVDWGDRDWLVLPVKGRSRGSAVEFSREFMLSAPGGWTPVVYGLIDRR